MFHPYHKQQRDLHDVDIKIIKRAFDLADNDKNGYLNREQLKIAHIVVFGCKPSKQEVEEIMDKYGRTTSNPSFSEDKRIVDFDKYKQKMMEKLRHTDSDDDVMETFQVLDARCKGFIDLEDFKKLVHQFLPNFDDLKIRRIFNESDRDGDGRVSFRDFQLLMSNDLYKT